MVRPGFEPTASRSESGRSTNWAFEVSDMDSYINSLRLKWFAEPQPVLQIHLVFVCLLWLFMSLSTIFQLCWDQSSWVEPVLSKDKCVLLKDTAHCRQSQDTWYSIWGLLPGQNQPLTRQLNICLLGNFACFFVFCSFFSKSTFSKYSFSCNTIRELNSLDPDQAQQNVGPDLDPNCLQSLQIIFASSCGYLPLEPYFPCR